MPEVIVGVDCATKPRNVGLARAVRSEEGFQITDVMQCGKDRDPLDVTLEWIRGPERVLLALDAPLGWPSALGRELGSHEAGDAILVPPEVLFRRATDRVVRSRTGKTPLDVGSNLIARTAHWALLFLYHLRGELGLPIPLAWSVPLQEQVEVIEVYPAVTLRSHGADLRGYKKAGARGVRATILEVIGRTIDCDSVDDSAVASSDTIDAMACVLAGVDFVNQNVVPPDQIDVAMREGWIWFRDPSEHP